MQSAIRNPKSQIDNGSTVIVVAYGDVPADAPEDEKDVLVEVEHVSKALVELGYRVERLPVTLDLAAMLDRLRALRPALVFNLVESLDGRDTLQHLPPSVFETFGIPFTGAGAGAIELTTNKDLTKRLLTRYDIPTPPWQRGEEVLANGLAFGPPYIVKLAAEDASRGITDDSVKRSKDDVIRALQSMPALDVGRHLVEQFVEGREFNVSVLEGPGGGADVLKPFEMMFVDFPPDKPTIVGFDAKWNNGSYEFSHTVRRFEYPPEDSALIGEIERISRLCWSALGLRGYARVDFRVDQEGRPSVLEINANPCISPDAGFVAATDRAGISYRDLIQRVVMTGLRSVGR